MPDLRKHPRFKIACPAVIWVIGRRSEKLEGRISNMSESGVQLRLSKPLSLGEAVQVEIKDVLFLGAVRYNESEQNQWLVGIELHNWIAKSKLEELLRYWAPPANLECAFERSLPQYRFRTEPRPFT